MDEMRVYIANLGKYNEGELVGAWFSLPVDEDEVKERIGLNDEYEEYAIHDYELPFEVDEYVSLEELNRLAEMVSDLPEEIQDNLKELLGYFSSVEELCESQDDIILYSGCDSMEDLAYLLIEEGGYLDGTSDFISRYFDYEAFARDLKIEGFYVETTDGIFEIRR